MANEIKINISDVAKECVKQEAERKQISMSDMIGIIINSWCVQQVVMGIRLKGAEDGN